MVQWFICCLEVFWQCWQPYYCMCGVPESGRYRPLAVVNRLMPNRFWQVGWAGWFNIVFIYLSLKYDTVSCMNIHEYIYANFERYAGICLTWKKLSFYWLISSCLDLVSVRVGSVSATCRSGLAPNRFWHVEPAGWFNIVADLFVTLIWYCFLHEYTWVYLC